MFWLFIQLALSSALFFQKLGKFVAYCLRDSHKGPQSFFGHPQGYGRCLDILGLYCFTY